MDDRRIEQLVKMALEAEALDGAAPIAGRIGPRRPWAAFAAAAACLLAGSVTLKVVWPAGQPQPPGPIAKAEKPAALEPVAGPDASPSDSVAAAFNAAKPAPIAEPSGADQLVVLTFFRDAAGGVPCYTWEVQDGCAPTPDRESTLGRTACSVEHDSVVTVAIAGPEGDLPTSDAEAVTLALCMVAFSNPSEQDGAALAAIIESCLPPSVRAAASIASVSH